MLSVQFIVVGFVIFFFVTLLYGIAVLIKRNDIADVGWGLGILLVALVSYSTTPEPSPLQYALSVLVSFWGLRLALRIGVRNFKKDEEDYRYKKWREQWSWFYLRSYVQVFLLQGLLMLVVGYPFVHASVYGDDAMLGIWSYVGIAIWCVGFLCEVIADQQLDRFTADPAHKGKILQSGLWRYSRHPNYFGEVTMWWGIWLMVAPLQFGVAALVSPILITYLILYVSGVPMLERKFAGDPAFEEYKARTSMFIPLPPKQHSVTA